MEQNQFDGLEEIETENNYIPEKKEKKEYEKLLGFERARLDYEKATSLIKFGCFKQEEKPTVDFSRLEKVDYEKKYKKVYNLYRNLDTMELVFILPLVENNKGDVDERKDLKPYAYDVIITEAMDNETFEMVCKAAKNNLKNPLYYLFNTGLVLYFVGAAFFLYTFIFNFISLVISQDFFTALALSLFYASTYFVGVVISSFVLVLAKIKLDKYKEN